MADPEGVPWVLSNLCFEGLPSKLPCANALPTLRLHCMGLRTSARVSTPASRIRRAHGLCARKYYQKHVQTVETVSELKLIHALLPLQLGIAICNQYRRTLIFPRFTRITSCFAASAAGPKLTISPQEYTRNNLRRPEIQNFPGGACPQTPLASALRALIAYWNPPFQNSRSATGIYTM